LGTTLSCSIHAGGSETLLNGDLREYVGLAAFAAVFGVVGMALVLPLVDRSSFVALPWTVIWAACGVLAWREHRRRTPRE
jgi:hypothetical protein